MGPSSVNEDERSPAEECPVTDLFDSPPVYTTELGAAFHGDSRNLLTELPADSIDLIITSPPFALQHQKEYGNKDQSAYNDWFMEFVPDIKRVLQPHGSFIVEMGGAFEKGWPRRSIYQWKLLTRIVEEADLEFAQDWYWYNPAKIPSPIEWVNVRKLRGVDAVTQIWWLADEINKDPAYTDDLERKVEMIEAIRNEIGGQLSNEELYKLAEAILLGTADVPTADTSEFSSEQITLESTSSNKSGDESERISDETISIKFLKSLLDDHQRMTEEQWNSQYELPTSDLYAILEAACIGSDEYYTETVRRILVNSLSSYRTLSVFLLISQTNRASSVYASEVLDAIEDGEPIRRPYPKPEVNNQRNDRVLKSYSDSQRKLIETGEYNVGERSSGHDVGNESFANENNGAIPKNFIEASNTASNTHYQKMCRKFGFQPHPARFPKAIPQKFINLLTPSPPYDNWRRGYEGCPGYLDRPIVLDIFAGSNWTGSVAEKEGRHWISFESDEMYAKTSEIRFLTEEEIEDRVNTDGDSLAELQS